MKKGQNRTTREDLCWLLKQIYGLASAIDFIHNRGASSATTNSLGLPAGPVPVRAGYHMDIKPENILWFEGDQTLRLSDFGCGAFRDLIARSGGQIVSHQTRNVMGNITYQAPEGLKGGKCGRPSDIWALGCLFLEMIVWFLKGNCGLTTFRADREDSVSGDLTETKGDRFFSVDPQTKETILRKPVAEMIGEIKELSKYKGGLKTLVDEVEMMIEPNIMKRHLAECVISSLAEFQNLEAAHIQFEQGPDLASPIENTVTEPNQGDGPSIAPASGLGMSTLTTTNTDLGGSISTPTFTLTTTISS